MSKKEDIPGFYRDPETGKYFREKPGDITNRTVEKLKFSRAVDIEKRRAMSVINTHGTLRRRELGIVGGISAETEHLRARTHCKEELDDVPVTTGVSYKVVSVDFIKGDKASVFGMWHSKSRKGKVRLIMGVENNWKTNFGESSMAYKLFSNTLDLCRGPANTLVSVFNVPNVFEMTKRSVHYAYVNRSRAINYPVDRNLTGTIHCCTAIREGFSYALGGNGFARFFNGFTSEYDMYVQGRVHTLSCDDAAKQVVFGTHYGALHVHDIESCTITRGFKVSKYCLNDSIFVDQNKVIVSDVDKTLAMVDLRVEDVVAFYHGHKHSVTKRPFSIANNMLCATGSDNVIRIWHIFGGEPVHQIRPLLNPENSIRGWLRPVGNSTYLDYFESHHKKIFKL